MVIAKHVPMQTVKKSRFDELVGYIEDDQNKKIRVGAVQASNCESTTIRAAVAEVLATQQQNTRVGSDKTYHLIVSFRSGETPTPETLKAVESRICAALGYGEHQRVSAVHYDTDNLHIHIAINKIHPARLTIHEPYFPYKTLAKVCAALEREYGLEPDNHTTKRKISEDRACDMERHSGIESMIGWVKRECFESMKAAKSWGELHKVMHENGLAIRLRGNGLVIQSDGKDAVTIKSSSLARDFSKPSLEKRLGTFEPDKEAERPKGIRRYAQSPIRLRVDTADLYARYQEERRSNVSESRDVFRRLMNDKRDEIEAILRANKLRRSFIKLLDSDRLTKRVLYKQAYSAMRRQIQAVQDKYQSQQRESRSNMRRRTWLDWLRAMAEAGDMAALAALRARQGTSAEQCGAALIAGSGGCGTSAPIASADGITKKGSVIYRIGKSAIRDDGKQIQVADGATLGGVRAALRMAVSHYGSKISVAGTDEFKKQVVWAATAESEGITFSDPALETRRQELIAKQREKQHGDERTGRPPSSDARNGAGRPGGSRGNGRRSVLDMLNHAPPFGGGRLSQAKGINQVRTVSSCAVVHNARRGEVLVPDHVHDLVENIGSASNDGLRRLEAAAKVTPGSTAAQKYIAERESKRALGLDVPLHVQYSANSSRIMTYAGWRSVDGEALALLKAEGDEIIMVMPVEAKIAARLKRLVRGERVMVSPDGKVEKAKSAGRSR
ncbi:MAG: relaxase/mobilization nuclease domain-containing protein [Azoarcus sp.]|jgi:hypothetical protein|nr:relaxase/mobilization nuclease domain-containing protein [Azoarcus sp.]